MTKQQLLVTWFKRVWEEEDSAAIYEYYAPEGKADGLGAEHRMGPDEFAAFHQKLLNLVGEVQVSYDKIIEEGDWISYMGTLNMVDRRTGTPVQMTGGAMCQIQNGKIIRAHNSWDFLSLFSQLGLLPGDAFSTLLSGHSLAQKRIDLL